MSKNSEKRCAQISSYSMWVKKVSQKNNFFCRLCKNYKILCHGTLFRSCKICLFYWDKTKILFYTKLCAVDIPLPTCMPNFFFRIFEHYKTRKKYIFEKRVQMPLCADRPHSLVHRELWRQAGLTGACGLDGMGRFLWCVPCVWCIRWSNAPAPLEKMKQLSSYVLYSFSSTAWRMFN